MYQEIDSVTVSNIYNMKIINKTNMTKHISFKLEDMQGGKLEFSNDISNLEKEKTSQTVLMIKIPKQELKGKTTNLTIGVYEENILLSTATINFIGPQK